MLLWQLYTQTEVADIFDSLSSSWAQMADSVFMDWVKYWRCFLFLHWEFFHDFHGDIGLQDFFIVFFLNVMHMQCIRITFTFHSLKPPSPPSELISQTLPSYLHVIFIPGDAKMLHLVQVFCSCAQLFFVTAKAWFYLHGRVLHQPFPYYIQPFLFFCPIFFSAPCVMETAI